MWQSTRYYARKNTTIRWVFSTVGTKHRTRISFPRNNSLCNLGMSQTTPLELGRFQTDFCKTKASPWWNQDMPSKHAKNDPMTSWKETQQQQVAVVHPCSHGHCWPTVTYINAATIPSPNQCHFSVIFLSDPLQHLAVILKNRQWPAQLFSIRWCNG